MKHSGGLKIPEVLRPPRCIYLLCLVFPFFCAPVLAQTSYFQQQADYYIQVSLNDRRNELTGQVQLHYTNHAPQALDTLYFHCWANALRSNTSAFAKQRLQQGRTSFYFATDEQKGGYRKLAFLLEGDTMRWSYHPEHQDIVILPLKRPLSSKQSITLTIPYQLDIPAPFSRLGQLDQHYQMTQWYPKPAVFDQDGWHLLPYLDQGEFYNEFGNYEVEITLPIEYIVAATGQLESSTKVQGKDERFLSKTLRYTAQNVHDFAWFADQNFQYEERVIAFPDGTSTKAQVYRLPSEDTLWNSALDYLERATHFFSTTVGPYPYPTITAVESAIPYSGAMEYPMITIVGEMENTRALDLVITHEVGHNWFYGMLGFNERTYPWLDEGMTTYYEYRYRDRYYADEKPWNRFESTTSNDDERYYQKRALLHLDQAPNTPSPAVAPDNYWSSAYIRPGYAMRHLAAYLGEPRFDRIMHAFFEQWRFKHPQPRDFRAFLTQKSGEPLNWYFDDLIDTNAPLDYALQAVEQDGGQFRILVENKGAIVAPFPLTGFRQNGSDTTLWMEGFEGEKWVNFPKGDYRLLQIDAQEQLNTIDRTNDRYYPGKRFPKLEPFRFSFFSKKEDPAFTRMNWLPYASWNAYDQWAVGFGIHNFNFYPQTIDYALFPAYSFQTNSLVGVGQIHYNYYPESEWLQALRLGVNGRSYHYEYIPGDDYDLQYWRLEPTLRLTFAKAPTATIQHELQWRSILLGTEAAVRDADGNYLNNEWTNQTIHELSYSLQNKRVLHPYHLQLALEQQSYDFFNEQQHYLKASLSLEYDFVYQHKKAISFRFFAGGFLSNTARERGAIFPGAFYLTGEGYADYRYDDLYLGRNEPTGIWSQQISQRDGGLHLALGSPNARALASNSFILAINLKADLPINLPFGLPLKPYFDLGYFEDATPTGANATLNDQLLWTGGVLFDPFNGLFSVHFPIINSSNVGALLEQRGNYWSRVTFSLDLMRLNPREWEQK
ncbi:MAG: M1 family metallopeptidase [Bacteroidota bacterium]